MALAGVAVLALTVWALVLPGVTMANTTFCGQKEHEHSDVCYQEVLVCGFGEDGEAAGGSALAAGGAAGSAESSTTASNGADGSAVIAESGAENAAGSETGGSSGSSASGHVHTDACYERVLSCGLSEHEHSLACYSDSSADLEAEVVWEATLPADDEMTGSWAADVLAAAKSQLGYRESSANYAVAENTAGAEVAKGYTRYGAWWGDAYGDWCAMFASFCLSYAGVSEEAVPQDANCQNWIEALSAEDVQLWRPVEVVENAEGVAERAGVAVVPAEVAAAWEAEAAEPAEEAAGEKVVGAEVSGDGSSARYTALGNLIYDPQPGDLVFFDRNNDGSADHVGFVCELLDADGNVVAEAAASESEAASFADGEGSEDASDDVPNGVDAAAEGLDAAAVATSSATAVKLKTIEGNVSDGSADAVCFREYDLADSSILGFAALPENPELQLATLASDEASLQAESAQASSGPTSFKGASTRDFVEINLYDYGSNINDLHGVKYPGFQQDGGVKDVGASFSKWSSFNFGNNITKDLSAGKSDLANKGGAINATTGKFDGEDYGNANLPIEGAMLKSLKDGYPALADGTSLGYLFSNGDYATKQNKSSIDGLFKYDEETGAYSFNSRENHAQFDSKDDTFTLYKQVITSNFMMYPFGNFLPFNDIKSQCKQASSIDKAYLQSVAADAQKKNGSEYQTLSTQLTKFISLMDKSYPEGWTGADCANEYFKAAGINKEFTADDLSSVYSIDYDEPTDFFFGMEMKMKFTQPKGGLTGKDGQQPMVFYFTGDDDVWVYVDDVLFLDLSGIHRHVGGEIDFVNGEVKYYALDVSTGDVSTIPYKTVKFSDLVGKNQLNEKGTFKDYSTHGFNFYYMERGAGSGVCRMNFNFPLLKQNTISVSKELAVDEIDGKPIEALGDPDYKFQILREGADGSNPKEDSFVGVNSAYRIYDENGEELGSGTTDANGVFKLKVGQRAEFDVKENAGRYYVRELLDGATGGQYGEIVVSGKVVTKRDDVSLGGVAFAGVDSPVKDISEGATEFRFTNKITEESANKLGSLRVEKRLVLADGSESTDVNREFEFEVALDGEPLPEGALYEVDGKSRTVEIVDISLSGSSGTRRASVVSVPAGKTATISNILLDSSFTVEELGHSDKGYAVTYSGDGVGTSGGLASGVVGSASGVLVTVTNSENGASINIPVTKRIENPDNAPHGFSFELVEVTDSSGSSLVDSGATPKVASLTVDSSGEISNASAFTLSYLERDEDALPAIHYYKISERIETSQQNAILFDKTAYVVKVTVDKSAEGKFGAAVSAVYRDGKQMWPSEGSDLSSAVSFTNTLLGSLEVSKTVEGTATGEEFSFEISLSRDSAGLPASYVATAYRQNGEKETLSLKLVGEGDAQKLVVDDGSNGLIALKHSERIVIDGIPYGTKWTATEINPEGFIVSTEVVCPTAPSVESFGDADASSVASSADLSANDGDSASSAGSGASSNASSAAVSGSIAVGTTRVSFTNTQMYELPETGGLGAAVCVFAGLALVGAALFGMRRICHREEAV